MIIGNNLSHKKNQKVSAAKSKIKSQENDL
jgi:hypothetical protein